MLLWRGSQNPLPITPLKSMSWLHPITTHNVNIDDINDIDDGNSPNNNDIVCLAGWGLLPEGSVAACTNMLCVTWFKLGADDDDYHDDDEEEEEEDEDSEAKQLNKILILVRCRRTKDNDCTEVLMVMMKMRMMMALTVAGGYTQVQRGVPISLSESCDSSHLVIWWW